MLVHHLEEHFTPDLGLDLSMLITLGLELYFASSINGVSPIWFALPKALGNGSAWTRPVKPKRDDPGRVISLK
jgi:hypothetical protein